MTKVFQSCSNHFLGSLWRYIHLAVQWMHLSFLRLARAQCTNSSCLASHSSLFLYSVFKVHLAVSKSRLTRYLSYLVPAACCLPLCCLALPLAAPSAAGTLFVLASVANCPAPAVVGSSGLEPPTSRLSGVRSNHLSYEPISVADCDGSLPSRPTVVEMNRIELSTPCLQGRCSPS